jgi:hypothetical protein
MMKGAEMADIKGFLSVKQYAEHRKVSRHTVYKYARNGKIQKSVYTIGGQIMIDPGAADKELSENLDRIYNPVKPSDGLERFLSQPPEIFPADDTPENRVEIQDQAADLASEGEDNFPGGYTHPWPIWAARYVGELWSLSPDRVDIERISKTKWRLRVDDIDNEDFEPCPWAVDLSFNLNPDQVEG